MFLTIGDTSSQDGKETGVRLETLGAGGMKGESFVEE
jgi:hypothetical protein